MKTYIEDIKKIYFEERWMLILIILNFVASIVLLVFSIVNLNPNSAVVKIGYGDIGGYRHHLGTGVFPAAQPSD